MSNLSLLRPSLVTASLLLSLPACSDDPTGLPGGGTGSTGNQGTGSTGNQGTGSTGNQGTGSTGNQGTGSTGNQGTGSTGNQGTGSTGNQGNSGGNANTGGGSGNSGGNGNPGAGGSDDGSDQNGKTDASPGDSSSVNQDYLKLGEIRILNNNWGSEDLGCNNSMFEVFVDNNSSFGWNFNRPACGGDGSKPDFPQVEFGVHPFGIFEGQGDHHLATSPNFSSTPLMPIQIQDVDTMSVTVNNLSINLNQANSWNITFEFWVSKENPLTSPDPVVYAELMTFWGWQSGRWPQDGPGMNGATDGGCCGGDKVGAYTLWVQRDNWADGWRYYQFRSDSGPQQTFSGTVNVKPFIDYLMGSPAYNGVGFEPTDWITRLEVGSEIDDNTGGTVRMDGITFEVNGESRSQVIAQ